MRQTFYEVFEVTLFDVFHIRQKTELIWFEIPVPFRTRFYTLHWTRIRDDATILITSEDYCG